MAHPKQKSPSLSKKTPRERLEARVRLDQKRLFQRAAALQGKTLTDFLIYSAQQEALKTIKDHEVVLLSIEDQYLFVDQLLNPAPPHDNLKKAAKRYLDNKK